MLTVPWISFVIQSNPESHSYNTRIWHKREQMAIFVVNRMKELSPIFLVKNERPNTSCFCMKIMSETVFDVVEEKIAETSGEQMLRNED